jgi:hypothetical protein
LLRHCQLTAEAITSFRQDAVFVVKKGSQMAAFDVNNNLLHDSTVGGAVMTVFTLSVNTFSAQQRINTPLSE